MGKLHALTKSRRHGMIQRARGDEATSNSSIKVQRGLRWQIWPPEAPGAALMGAGSSEQLPAGHRQTWGAPTNTDNYFADIEGLATCPFAGYGESTLGEGRRFHVTVRFRLLRHGTRRENGFSQLPSHQHSLGTRHFSEPDAARHDVFLRVAEIKNYAQRISRCKTGPISRICKAPRNSLTMSVLKRCSYPALFEN
jgi:hypothetical protein